MLMLTEIWLFTRSAKYFFPFAIMYLLNLVVASLLFLKWTQPDLFMDLAWEVKRLVALQTLD